MAIPEWATKITVPIRTDVKVAMEELAERRWRVLGNRVGLAGVFTEAALLLLNREGISLNGDAEHRPVRKPAKSVARRKVAVRA
jgi:hypothetical protein